MTNIDEIIAKTRALAAKISTSEPLTVSDGSKPPFLEGIIAGNRVMAKTNYYFDPDLADAAFIAHACNSILALADEVERLRARLKRTLLGTRAGYGPAMRLEMRAEDAERERDALRAENEALQKEAQKYHDLLLAEQLKTPEARELDVSNASADSVADKLRTIAETGIHRGVFGGVRVESAAQAILALVAERDEYYRILNKADLLPDRD